MIKAVFKTVLLLGIIERKLDFQGDRIREGFSRCHHWVRFLPDAARRFPRGRG